jgi:hypothetical protein
VSGFKDEPYHMDNFKSPILPSKLLIGNAAMLRP